MNVLKAIADKVNEKWYVYRGVNNTKREIYYGVSKSPTERVNGGHCRGGTKALAHWDCASDDIVWIQGITYTSQEKASARAHSLEKKPPPAEHKGYTVIQTAGI